MVQTYPTGYRHGTVRPELKDVVAASVRVIPDRAGLSAARSVLDRDGAVIVPCGATDPEQLVVAAATMLGGRLRRLFAIRLQSGVDSAPMGLHSDGMNVVIDVHGQHIQLRHPDEDYLFMLCSQPAEAGGDSFVVDGYALVDALREARPELHAFLTGCDVDYCGGSVTSMRGVPPTPLVRRLVEYTRTGRRVVRAGDFAAPVPREPRWDIQLAHLDDYADVRATATECAPRFRLEAGELLALDNYRFMHGRDGFRGERVLHVLTVCSSDAW